MEQSAESKYTIYYWPISFRGEFIKILLTSQGIEYSTAKVQELLALKNAPVGSTAGLNFMAPPLLYDMEEKVYVSQTGTIVSYLARKHHLVPQDHCKLMTAEKLVNDCNDVLAELTRNNGSKMWEEVDDFKAFLDGRFKKWLQIIEKTGTDNGLKDGQYYLGGEQMTFADTSLVACFGVMDHCLGGVERKFGQVLRLNAPTVMQLVDRLKQTENIKAYFGQMKETPYCGGQIEASIRKMCDAL